MRNKIIVMLMLFLMVFHSVPANASSDSQYYSNLDKDEISKIFSLDSKDIKDPWNWVADAQTFVIVEKTDEGLQYWWNTPNMQMTSQNELYNMITNSGYGSGVGELAKDREWLITLPESSQAHTAMQKYGFNIQNPTYLGERPLETISICGVLLPDNLLNTVNRVMDLIFKGKIVSIPTNKDLDTLMYVSPRDYNPSAITFKNWVKNNWSKAMNEMQSGQVLMSKADPKTGKDKGGKIWIKKNIITSNGLDKKGLSADYICSKLEYICGTYYADVCKNIVIASGINNNHITERIMPYDLEAMNSIDKSMFNGVSDPRSEMQKNMLNTGYKNTLKNMFSNSILGLSGKLSEISIVINNVSTFSFMESVGFNPNVFWQKTIIDILIFLMFLFFIFYCIKCVINVVSGSKSVGTAFRKSMLIFLMVMFVYSLSSDVNNTYSKFKNLSNTVLNLGNSVLERQLNISSLYGTGNSSEKEQCELWLPYFNLWTVYNTNHSLQDAEQTIDKNDGMPETKNLKTRKISNVDQKLWCTILADTFSNNSEYGGDIYRVVDHFMAPRITKTKLNSSSMSVDVAVKTNENYNGNIQSNLNVVVIPFQILILFLIIFKMLLFFELMLNIIMLIYNLALSITNMYDLKKTAKSLITSNLNIFIINIVIMIVVWSSLIVSGIAGLVICAMYIFLVYHSLKQLSMGNSSFTPKFFKIFREAQNRVLSAFR